MHRRQRILVSALAVLLILLASASYATSTRGNVNANNSRFFGFTMPSDGGVEITLTWNQNHSDLFLVMSCGSGNDPLEYSSIATENRVARLDAGVLGGLSCVIGVASFQRSGTFTMALSTTGRGPGLRVLRPGTEPLIEVTELEAEAMGLFEVEDKLRSLRE